MPLSCGEKGEAEEGMQNHGLSIWNQNKRKSVQKGLVISQSSDHNLENVERAMQCHVKMAHNTSSARDVSVL